MDCPNCGKSMGYVGNQFWCPKCRAYYCYSCVKNKLVCPKCGGRISADKSSIMPISFTVVVILMLAVGFLTASVFNYTYEYTKISNLQPGDHVRIYGEINSSEEIVATVKWVNDDWQLQNHASFSLVDPGNSSSEIPINLSLCKYFNLGEKPSSGQDTYEYHTGDRVTVLGWVTTDESGNLSLNATSMYPGRLSNESVFPSFLFWPAGMFAIITVVIIIFQLYRRSLHRRYLEQNPVLKMPQLPLSDTFPEGLMGWIENPLLKKRIYWNKVILAFSVLTGVPLSIAGLFLLATSTLASIILMFVGVYIMVVTGPISYYFTYNTPSRIALADDGLHLQYAKARNPNTTKTFIAWNDIKNIQPRIQEKDNGIRMELNDGLTVLWASREIQDAVLEAFHSHNAPRTEAGQSSAKAQYAPGFHQATESPPEENWEPREVIRNRMADWTAMLGGIMIAASLIGCLAYLSLNLDHMDQSRWMNFGLIGMMFSINGILLLTFRFVALDTAACSKSGITLKFLASRKALPPIPWRTITRVPPLGLGWFFIQLSSGEKIKMIFTERRIGQKIIEWLDGNYLETHPGIRGSGPGEPISEKLDNRVKADVRRNLLADIGAIIAGFALAAVSFAFFIARIYETFAFVGLFLSTFMIAAPVAFIGGIYTLWKNAPYAIGLNGSGLMADFHGKPPPAGYASFVSWAEIAGIESLPEAVGSIQLTWNLRDTEKRNTVVIRKRSGTAHILGPVDPAIANALRQRMQKGM